MKALPLFLCVAGFASAQPYTISTVAGNGPLPFGGGNAPAVNARLVHPFGVAADSAGNVFISDQYYEQVFKVTANGIITVYAGNGVTGFLGDKGPAVEAQFTGPGLMVADPAGNLYIADTGPNRVRRVTLDGKIDTVTNVGSSGVALDAKGNLYVTGGNSIHMVAPDGTTSVIAGTGKPGYSGDKSQAKAALLNDPRGIRIDPNGNIFFADAGNNVVRKITPQGIISTVAGNGTNGIKGSGIQATAAQLSVPQDVALDASGNLYITDNSGSVRRVDANSVIQSIAGGGLSLQDGPAAQADLIFPIALAIDTKGNLLVALLDNKQVRRVTLPGGTPPPGTIATVAGAIPTASFGEGVPATSVPLLAPYGVALDGAGNIYVADWDDERIREVSTTGTITTVAGNGIFSQAGDNGPAVKAQIGSPFDLGFDSAGNLYVSAAEPVVRRIATDGTITTFAGGGAGSRGAGASAADIGDGGRATSATLDFPKGVAADAAGNVYIADQSHHRVRIVNPSGVINTYAGTGVPGYSGDNGPATSAQLTSPGQLAVDKQGNLYVADTGNGSIRMISPAGVITTVAGTGVSVFSGDGGPAIAAQLLAPTGVAVDSAGNIYIAGAGGRVRKVDASSGNISTIAGSGVPGFSGDGGLAISAQVDLPTNITVDGSGNVYFTELLSQRVRMLTPQWISSGGVLNAASLLAGPVSPGEIIAISVAGVDLTQTGAQVTFDGTPADVVSTQAGQVTVIVPYEVYGETSTQLQIVAGAITTNTIQIPVADAVPGIFTADSSGQGAGVITNADGSPNQPGNGAASESQVTISATGEGQTNPPGVDGQITPATPPMPIQQVSVQIGGVDAPVVSFGGTPGQPAGYFQVVVQIPDGAPSGDAIPIVLMVGSASSQPGVTISIQ